MARDTARMPPTPSNLVRIKALCRGGIVLLCSHLEGYVEALGALAISRVAENRTPKSSLSPSFKYYLSRDLIDNIVVTVPETVASRIDDFLNRDGHIWDSSTRFSPPLPVDQFVGRFATPNHENIRGFFRRFGYQNFHSELAAQLQVRFSACTNMVNHVVDQRNKIAHGDSLTDGTPTELHDMCSLVKLYCRHTDEVVGNWFKSRGCPIR